MRMYKLNSDINASSYLKALGVDEGAKSLLKNKMQYHLIKIEHLRVEAANILKQDALSIGAELAVPRGVISCETPYVDAILMGTTKHLKILSKKELAQPFGLKKLALELKNYLKPKKFPLQVMGIINANDDSFFAQSRFKDTQAVIKIQQMIKDGASIIDVGGVSSRPGSDKVDPQEELDRVKPIIDAIFAYELHKEVRFSIDSYEPLVIEYALNHGFTIINDITGLSDDRVCALAAKHKAQVVIMHMLGDPQSMQDNPSYESVIADMSDFFYERIQKAKSFGITDIVLDVGIGFGKRLEDNLMLIKHHKHFEYFGLPLLVGASRKSMIDKIKPTPIEERLPATLTIHLETVKQGASIIRCHDVKEHIQALSILEALKTI